MSTNFPPAPIQSVTEAFEAVNRAKLGAAAFCTNFFPVESKLQAWIDHGDLFGEYYDGAAFFFRHDRGFYHQYFATGSLDKLQPHLGQIACLTHHRVVTDLIGPEATIAELLETHKTSGFVPHRKLIRLSRPATSPVPPQTE